MAVVTGASGGIGAAVARRLAAAGARVVLVARGPEPLERVAEEVGGTAVAADLTRGEAGALAAALGGGAADVLVNAAGDFALAPVAETDPAMFDRMIDANLRAPFAAIRALLPAMLAAGRGHVVTIGSVAGRRAFPHNGAYSAAKFGVRGLHEVLDEELRGTGVRATLLDPAATDTGLWDAIDRKANPGLPAREAMLSPDRVADAVLYVVTRPPDVRIPALAVERS